MPRFSLFFLTLLGLPLSAWAQHCAVDPLFDYTKLGGDTSDNRVHVDANTSESNFATADFFGEVKVRQGDKHLFAPVLKYQREEALFTADEGVILGMPHAAVKGEGGKYFMDENRVTFEQADYFFTARSDAPGDNGSGGFAEKAEINRETHIDKMENVTWTTCERLDPTWQLKARHLRIDNNENRAVARDTTFRIGDTPVFWLPYFSFPTNNERASGFLMPSVGTSDERGFEFSLPYYWNIAPNQDATFTLHPMSKRGLMVEGEYRFMTHKHYGEIFGAVLPADKEYENKNRWHYGAVYRYDFAPDWQFDLDYKQVSDIDYVDNLDRDLDVYDDWYLDRFARIRGGGAWGNLMLRVQDYERISPRVSAASTPYSRMPQIVYNKSWKADDFRFSLGGEAVRFTKDDFGSANRYSANVEAAYRLGESYGFLEPKVSFNVRRYDFNPENGRFRDGSKTLAQPTFSLDGGLIFERDFQWGGEGYTQTLEPRLFYLYTPYRDQSDIPNFDTSELSKSWNWLFSRNRFSGGDKIGDANQLTTAVSSRFYRNNDGQEKARISLGQIQYFDDRRVQLGRGREAGENKSVIVSEGLYNIDRHWTVYGLSFWDPNYNKNERNIVDLRYNLDSDRYIHLRHRYKENDYDQVSLGGGWRLNPQWRLFARHDYSLRYDTHFNTMAGVEYDDCCWAWRLVGRHYRQEPDDPKSHNGIYLEFIFKGLGNMGSRTGRLLDKQLNNFKPLPQERSL